MANYTENLGLFKYDVITDENVPFSITNALNNNWDILDEKCGNARNIGEIVTSSLPLTDAGLHLLDGALIEGNGIYNAFVDYIAGLVSDYPNLFCTESEWQTSVTTYGVCGKFVYDSTNNTVRLPKITGIIEGTTDISALGDLVEAGLPNITGKVGAVAMGDGDLNGCFGNYTNADGEINNTNANKDCCADFNASWSNSIYGNSTTVQPQTIKAFYYIVIATSTKTDIQVDIDEIATDLNGKVNKSDLQEVQCVVETYHNGASWYRVYSDGWCEQGGFSNASKTINLLKTYTNTDYTISIATKATGTGSGLPNVVYWTKTASSFYINLDYVSSNRNAGGEWQACGYIEV